MKVVLINAVIASLLLSISYSDAHRLHSQSHSNQKIQLITVPVKKIQTKAAAAKPA